VHKVNGVVVKIEGNDESPIGEGHVCAKGAAGIMQLYDTNRVTKPMKRTNPQKGMEHDPGWQEISWNEAYTIVSEKLKELHSRAPNRLLATSMVSNNNTSLIFFRLWAEMVFGGDHFLPDICGVAIHPWYDLLTGTGNGGPDYDFCKYVLQFGCNSAISTRHAFNMTVRRFADAREKGCKLVSVDPHMSASAEKSDLWVPILPGTDAPFALAIQYVLVHELGIYDRNFLRKYTNGAYLVDVQSKRFIRDAETGTPYIWDVRDNKAKLINDPSIENFAENVALEGGYTVNGVEVQTGFELFKEHIRQYTPEKAEQISTVPSEITRRVAKEIGEAANIGGTIELEGRTYPYRPIAVDCFSGLTRHKNAWHMQWSIFNINVLLGALNVPGGLISFSAAHKGLPNGRIAWYPQTYEPDHMLEATVMLFPIHHSHYAESYADRTFSTKDPSMLGLMAYDSTDPHWIIPLQLQPNIFGTEPFEIMWIYGSNVVKHWGNLDEMGEYLKSFKYVIQTDIYLNDSSYYTDLILPEASYLERYDPLPNACMSHHTKGAYKMPWVFTLRQPVVQARDNCPSLIDMLTEVNARIGLLAEYNGFINYFFGLNGKEGIDLLIASEEDKNRQRPDHSLALHEKHYVEEISDKIYKSYFGDEHGLEWFKKYGIIKYPRTIDEIYLYPYVTDARVPLYGDFLMQAGEKVREAVKKYSIKAPNYQWDLSEYIPLPTHLENPIDYIEKQGLDKEFDLYAVYYTSPVTVDTWAHNNSWLNEMLVDDPYGYNIEINTATAKAKGIRSGDDILLISPEGYKVKGRAMLVEGVHPKVVASCGGCFDNKSQYQPISRGRGVAFNNLYPVKDITRYSTLSSGWDNTVRVKVVKA
jgi:molybdopterin-containing oxidoreductase family molybdopterin binding subunit